MISLIDFAAFDKQVCSSHSLRACLPAKMEEAPGASKDDKTRTAAWRSGALIVTERIRPVLEAALAASDDSGSENQRSGLQRQVRGEVEHVLSCLKEREESERSQSEPPAAQGGDLPGIRAATLMQCCQVVR